ncbi:uridine 5'-monophosphate synthase-like [Oculina patagonica]
MASEEKKFLIERLHDINAIKFGDFTLKSGIQSPVYVDLRVIVSYPEILKKISDLLWDVATASKAEFSVICGVPYTALPIASSISVSHNVPMVMRRKEAKSYGTKRLIEGVFTPESKCLVIEDVVTSGSSVLETVEALASVALRVSDTVVLLDRFQGGKEMLQSQGVKLHSLITLPEVLEVLSAKGKVDQEMAAKVREFLSANKFQPSLATAKTPETPGSKLSFEARAEIATNPLTKRLFQIMHKKRSNLAVSADFTTCAEVLSLAEKVGPHVCIVKTHVDILEDFTPEFAKSLQQLAEKHNFVIFEDRKFADIGNTVKNQYSKGVYHIAEWAHLVNAHVVPGDGVVKGLKEIGASLGRACLLIGEMSSAGTLATGEYSKAAVEMAKNHKDFVIGFISLSCLTDDPQFIHMTPGVQLNAGGDKLGQQYLTPTEVIVNRGSDVIIVGRGVYQADDPVKAALQYKEEAFAAYMQRTGK